MNIALRRGNLTVTHNFLNNTGLDALLYQVGAGGVAAAVGGQFSGANALQCGIVFFVEIILVNVNQLLAGRSVYQIIQNRKNCVCKNDGRSFADVCL